jgi:hypothetical protein
MERLDAPLRCRTLIEEPLEDATRYPDRAFVGAENHGELDAVAQRKLRRRQLTDDGNVEITGRELREKTPPVGQGSLFARAAAG